MKNNAKQIVFKVNRKYKSKGGITANNNSGLSFAKRIFMVKLQRSLQQVKDHMDGKIQLKSVETLLDELRDNGE